jgi:hypothetical protein
MELRNSENKKLEQDISVNDLNLNQTNIYSSCSSLKQAEKIYSKPMQICNIDIVDKKSFSKFDKSYPIVYLTKDSKVYRLKSNLQEVHDYMKLDEHIWFFFKNWYRCDFEIII